MSFTALDSYILQFFVKQTKWFSSQRSSLPFSHTFSIKPNTILFDAKLKQKRDFCYCCWFSSYTMMQDIGTGLILGLPPANDGRRCKTTPSVIGWTQTYGCIGLNSLRPSDAYMRRWNKPRLVQMMACLTTVLFLTWESSYWQDSIFILRRGPTHWKKLGELAKSSCARP